MLNVHKLVLDVQIQELPKILEIYVISPIFIISMRIFVLLYALIHRFLCAVITSIVAIKHGWVEYIQQPVLPASLAFVLLYFNIALAPSGLMTAFLTHHGTV